jgi:tRNA A-37 threonylcarbamoyl transferase component Bud32
MKLLSRTLQRVIKDQGGALTPDQQTQIVALFQKLSDEGIRHNDDNIKLNMMIDDETGKLYLIDFGMAKKQTAADVKRWGPATNFTLLGRLNNQLVSAGHDGVFDDFIREYEALHGVVVDVMGKRRRDREGRLAELISRTKKLSLS